MRGSEKRHQATEQLMQVSAGKKSGSNVCTSLLKWAICWGTAASLYIRLACYIKMLHVWNIFQGSGFSCQ